MEINDITTIITSVGFPIAMCVWFFYWFTTSYKKEQENTRAIIDELKETVVGLKSTVETLTTIINAQIIKENKK